MLNLSIMPLDPEHVDEICESIINDEKAGTYTDAMLMMQLSPEGTPPRRLAAIQARTLDEYKRRLDPAGARYGVLVQSTMGHISKPQTPHPFTPTVSLSTGEERTHTCCPLDESFREHMKEEMRELAKRRPSMVMIDDDVGLLYRDMKGCACPLHMAEFNRRAGTSMSREELYSHTLGDSDEDRKYTQIYVETVRDSLVGFVRSLREGLDEVDPSIRGIISGIYVSTFCEFSGDIASAFAGSGHPATLRMNNGMYTAQGPRFFTKNMYRAAVLRENVKDKVDVFLAETDTCPQNRYSTSAALLHAHFAGTILEGATGAKHWITRLSSYEPRSGIAYRKKLSRYSKFYEALADLTTRLQPFGCKIPLSRHQDYAFKQQKAAKNTSPWSTCVLERLGLPLYFGNGGNGAVFLDDLSVDRFCDAEILDFLSGTLVLSGGAAESLVRRGFGKYIGVSLEEWKGKPITTELYRGVRIKKQMGARRINVCDPGVEVLSHAIHQPRGGEREELFPASTLFENSLGGAVIVFCGNPDTLFNYVEAFSFLTETRKAQFIDVLGRLGHLPVYYPEDADVYVRAGRLDDGRTMAAIFNLSLDVLDGLPLVIKDSFTHISMMNETGELVPCQFEERDGAVIIDERVEVLEPLVLIIE